MTSAQTSLIAYHDPLKQANRKRIRDINYVYVATHPDCTQPEFCEEYSMQAHHASGRFTELVKEGMIMVTGRREEKLTGGSMCGTYQITAKVIV